jgi:hypothetical protein
MAGVAVAAGVDVFASAVEAKAARFTAPKSIFELNLSFFVSAIFLFYPIRNYTIFAFRKQKRGLPKQLFSGKVDSRQHFLYSLGRYVGL